MVKGGAGITRGGGVVVMLSVLLSGACTGSPTEASSPPLLQVTSEPGLVFMTQNVRPEHHMDALFTGAVLVDDDGCLRVDMSGRATVVWPTGYSVTTSGSGAVILDDQSTVVGAVGEDFSLAGGATPTLLASMGFTDRDRTLAESCPGEYWIVADTD